jgi:adenylylsulfate kinase
MTEQKFIIPQDYHITKADRQKSFKHKSFVVWFTGLSGSGKSTLANLVEQRLHSLGCHTYILDGDNVRHGLNKDLGFDETSRQENIRRIGEVAKLMVDAGVIVLTAFISPFRSDRQLVRELLQADEYVEVFVNCPLEICEQRDVKGLYQKARAGMIKNFTGIDSPFEAPASPEVEVETNVLSLEESMEKVFQAIQDRLMMNE